MGFKKKGAIDRYENKSSLERRNLLDRSKITINLINSSQNVILPEQADPLKILLTEQDLPNLNEKKGRKKKNFKPFNTSTYGVPPLQNSDLQYSMAPLDSYRS